MAQTNRRKRRPQIDPKTLKKRSQIAQRKTPSVVVTGEKEATSTGFRILGHSGKVIETYYETLLAGTASDTVVHHKKDRIVRILAGIGFVVLSVGSDDPVTRKVYAGDELVFKAGTTHRLVTTSDQGLELHVSQEAKYDHRMEVVAKSDATKEVSEGMLQPSVRDETVRGIQPRRGSKARMQQAIKSGGRVPSGQVFDSSGQPVAPREAADGIATAVSGLNARPSMGRFDEAGAG